jgi:UDP-N-acetylglucosamine/UDP-N-acetylgalactosamine 4-epimerase
MKTYLVTGAAGFIASNIVDQLLTQNAKVIGLDNLSTGFQENLDAIESHPNSQNFQFIKGDIRDLETCQKACKNVDYVLHLAALGSVPRSMEMPLLYDENNITGTLNMLIAAKDNKAKRFIFSSSSSVYGDTLVLPKTETMNPLPKSPYAISKITGEYYCKIFNESYGLPTIIFRYFNVFGPRQNPKSQYAAVIPKFITSFLENTSPTIFGDGEQTRDFTFVKNVVLANIKACEMDLTHCGKAINMGCGARISVNDLAANIKKITQSTAPIDYKPPRAGDVKDSLADIVRSQEWLGLTNPTQLTEGLDITIKWYKKKQQ